MESRTQGSRPRPKTHKRLEAKAKNQGHRRKRHNNNIITETCITPFLEVNQIKGALQKIEKQYTQKAQKNVNVFSVIFFIFAFYLPKPNLRDINPHPGN